MPAPFKEGTWVEHVHAFRDLKTQVVALDQDIDAGRVTPHEALDGLGKLIAAFPAKPKEKK